MGAFIGRHVCGVGPNYPPEVKKNETMRLGLEDPAAYTDDGWPYQSLAIYGRLCSGGFFFLHCCDFQETFCDTCKRKTETFCRIFARNAGLVAYCQIYTKGYNRSPNYSTILNFFYFSI